MLGGDCRPRQTRCFQAGGESDSRLPRQHWSGTLPDGRKRFIFFERGKAVGADLSQADGNMEFHVSREAGLNLIRAGGWIVTIVPGIAGSWVGGFIASVLGAMLLLRVHRLAKRA